MIELCDRLDCTGCSACMNACPKSCISMVEDREGFLFPEINHDKCVECGLCAASCPILTPVPEKDAPEVYASWNLNESIRCSSSSGGLFHAIASHVISVGGVVYGAVLADSSVCHARATSMEEVVPMMGSKYLQSEIHGILRDVLDDLRGGRQVLFTGTPCQIAGLRGFLGKRIFDNLFLVDIVCHGVPSKLAFRDYLEFLHKRIGKFEDDSYRFRMFDGWGLVPSVNAENGRMAVDGYDNHYYSLFIAGALSRESCYNCRFTRSPRCSDITIADFWGIDKTEGFSGDCSKGCSLVLVNSRKGRDMMDSLSEGLFLEKHSLTEAEKENNQLYKPSVRPPYRDKAYDIIKSEGIRSLYLRSFFRSPYRRIRHFVGNLRYSLKTALHNRTCR